MFFHTFFTFCQAEKSSFRRKNTRVVTAFLKGEKRHGSAIADGSQRQPCEDGTARRLHGRRRPYEGGAGGKAWRESAPFRQPGTAQMWPCGRGRRQSRPYGRAQRRGGLAAGRLHRCGLAAGAGDRAGLTAGRLRGALFRRSQNAAWPAAKHGGKALPFGSRAQRRGGLAAGHSAGVALRGSVCTGVFARGAFRRSQNAAWPAAKHGGKALPFGGRAQRRGGLTAGAGDRGGLARECLRGSVCAGRFSAIPKCRMAGGVVFTFQRGCPGGSARRALFAAGAVSGARCMGSDRLPPGRVQKAGHRENSRRPAKQKP